MQTGMTVVRRSAVHFNVLGCELILVARVGTIGVAVDTIRTLRDAAQGGCAPMPAPTHSSAEPSVYAVRMHAGDLLMYICLLGNASLS